jgi:branched-chain amino acid transport system ATP-binding protein
VLYDGRDVTDLPAERKVREGVFLVMEGRGIVQDMTITENLRLGAFTRPNADTAAEIEEVYHFFPRLRERKGLAGYLSGGEQQMLAIGRALMAKPKLILMDEPSMGLSPAFVDQVFDIIGTINRQGVSILVVEQNAAVALGIGHRGYVLQNGGVVMAGEAAALLAADEIKRAYLGEA